MPETTSSPNDEPSPVAVAGVVEHLGPVMVGPPAQTTAVAASRDAVWVAYHDDGGGHLARIDPETLAVVTTIDDVPTPRWEAGGGGMAIGGDGTVWIGGDDRLVAIRDDSVVVDRRIDGCCADVSAGALGLYVLLDTTTDLARPQGVVHLVDPDGSIEGDGTIVTGLVPRRLAQTASGYLGIIGWATSDDGGITGAKVIPLHFEDVPSTIDGPTSDSGITVTSTGWTVAADGGLTRLDITNLLQPAEHVDVPVGRIAAIVETRQGVWVLGRERAVLVGADTGNVRFNMPLPDGGTIDPSCGTAVSGTTVYLLSCDGSVSGLAFGG
jgi:hypothetical protein